MDTLSTKGRKPVQKLALLLPSMFPDVHWLLTCQASDFVIIHDTEPFNRKSRVHRGKIRTPNGSQWLRIPVHSADRNLPLHVCRIDHSQNWLKPLWQALEFNYRNSIYFDFYEGEIRADLEHLTHTENYLEGCQYMFSRLLRYLGFKPPSDVTFPELHYASRLLSAEADTSVNGITDFINPEVVYQEIGSKNYHQPSVRVGTPTFPDITYRQHFGGFEPGCCMLDYLFEAGPADR